MQMGLHPVLELWGPIVSRISAIRGADEPLEALNRFNRIVAAWYHRPSKQAPSASIEAPTQDCTPAARSPDESGDVDTLSDDAGCSRLLFVCLSVWTNLMLCCSDSVPLLPEPTTADTQERTDIFLQQHLWKAEGVVLDTRRLRSLPASPGWRADTRPLDKQPDGVTSRAKRHQLWRGKEEAVVHVLSRWATGVAKLLRSPGKLKAAVELKRSLLAQHHEPVEHDRLERSDEEDPSWECTKHKRQLAIEESSFTMSCLPVNPSLTVLSPG